MQDKLKSFVVVSGMIVLMLFISAESHSQTVSDSLKMTPERLFHIARSLNRNLVCYDVNISQGVLDEKEPVTVYWLNREENFGKTNGISFFQQRAYGYKIVSAGQDECKISLYAYPKKELTITKRNGKYVCTLMIENKKSILSSLYVKAHPSNPLKVEYVELYGTTIDGTQQVSERVSK